MSTTFYRKYRPQNFSEVVGQKHIVTTLVNALKLGKVGQAYLFTGPRGTGKTTLARLFAKAINCSNRKGSDLPRQSSASAEPCGKCPHCILMAEGRTFDVIEIDAASHTGVDNIRELRETIKLPPTLGSHRIYIIDEVHMLSIGAFNALLKTLEEPPAHVVFILATTALHKVPATILSRCQRFDLSRFPVKSIVEKLTKIAKEEKIKIDSKALEMIALTAEGGMRDAESLLMQIATLESPITEDSVVAVLGTTKKVGIVTLLQLIGERDLYGSLSFIRKLVENGTDLAIFSGVLLHYLRDLLLVSANPTDALGELEHLTEEEQQALISLSKTFTPEEIVLMLEYFQVAQVTSKTAVIAELPLEIAVVKFLSRNNQQSPKNDGQAPPISGREQSPKNFVSGQAPTETKEQTTNSNQQITPSESASNLKSKILNLESDAPQSENANSENNLELSEVQKRWPAILNTAKHLNASLSLGLSTARPVEITGQTLIIAVKYPFHKERLDEIANQLTLSTAFATILGVKIKTSIILESTTQMKDEPQKSSASGQAPKEAFIENPLVSKAMEMLGGKLVGTENS